MDAARRVLRNSLFGIASEAIGGALSFLIIILIARALGSAQFGAFSYILAVAGIFQLVADFGLTNILVKEISRDKERAPTIVGAVKPLVWIFSLTILAVVIALAQMGPMVPQVRESTYVMGAAVLATFHAVVYGSVFRAFERMGFNAIGFVTHKFILLGLVLAAMHLKSGILGFACAFLVANLYQWGFFYWLVRKYFFRFAWHVDGKYWKYLLWEAFPVGTAMVFRRVSLHVGTLLLTAMSTTTAVGLYSAAYKIIQIVDIIPFTLSITLFPQFSRLAKESVEKMQTALIRALRIFMLIALPLFGWILVVAPQLVALSFGPDFVPAVSTLRVLSGAVLFLFPTALYVYVFTALGAQKFYTLSSGICLAINVALDLLLIPYYGALGAAIGTLFAEFAFFVGGAFFLKRLGYPLPYGEVIIRPTLVVAVAGIILLWATQNASTLMFLVANLAYFVAYVGSVFVLGLLRTEELAVLKDMFQSKPKSAKL